MKKTIFTMLAALVLGGMIVAICLHAVHQRQTKAITRVLETRKQFVDERLKNIRAKGKNSVRSEHLGFLKDVERIKLDGCPKDFQFAWIEYVHSWRRYLNPSEAEKAKIELLARATKASASVDGDSQLSGGAEFGGLAKIITHGAKINGSIQSHKAISVEAEADAKNVNEAAKFLEQYDWRAYFDKVQTIALAHGVNALNYE